MYRLRAIPQVLFSHTTLSVFAKTMSSQAAPRKVALVLHGCGVYDGSEIHEATSMLIHLSKAGADVAVFAPNIDQAQVTDHSLGSQTKEKRNVLVEAARISRGNILPLSDLQPANFDALFIPGGFGVATTLSDFATSGASCKVIPDIERTLKGFVDAKKPIGLCCIAPVLAARCLPGVRLTLGKEKDENGRWQNSGACQAAKEMGAEHEPCDITGVCVDEKNKLVTAPAYMCSTATVAEVFDNIGLLVTKALSLIR